MIAKCISEFCGFAAPVYRYGIAFCRKRACGCTAIGRLHCTKEKAMDLLKIPPEMQPKILALL